MGSLALLSLPETAGRAVDAAKAAAAVTPAAPAAMDAEASAAISAPSATTSTTPADIMAVAEEGRAGGRAGVEAAHLEAAGGVELVEATTGGASEADHMGLVARSGGARGVVCGGVCCWGGGGRRGGRRSCKHGCRRWCALQAEALASLRTVGVRVCISSQVRCRPYL